MKSYASVNQRLIERVCYLSKPASEDTDLFGNKIMVKNTFPYNPESKSAPDTADRWANHGQWNYKTNRYENVPKEEPVELANDPFRVWVIDLDIRSQGGRAYKVIDEQDRCFDLREDQVLEVFKHCGVAEGGSINGSFVWGILGSQMRMVLVGGDQYNEMVKQAAELKTHKEKVVAGLTPTEGSLEFGHIYRKRDQSLHVFLGRVKAPGKDKTLFAFVALPVAPYVQENIDQYDEMPGYKEHARESNEIAKNWVTMSWIERCNWDWYGSHAYTYRQYAGQVEPHYYDALTSITLMSSPKFEADVGEALELAELLHENAGSKHKYVKGNNDDLSEERYKAMNNGKDRDWYNHPSISDTAGLMRWHNLSYEERKVRDQQIRMKVSAECIADRAKFQSELVWE